MKWIKTSDRLPEINKRVLIFYNNGSIDIGRLKWNERIVENTSFGIEIKYNTRWTNGHQDYNVDITHWSELVHPSV